MSTGDVFAVQYRYEAVFLVILAVVVLVIVTPDGNASRAVTFALIGGAWMYAVGTSRAPSALRHRRAVAGSVAVAVIAVGIATGLMPRDITFLVGTLVTLAIPLSLGRGLLRLVREQGATYQAVAGALAIYLAFGLAFSALIGFVAAVGPIFFAQGTNASASVRLYYSFSVLTTTGFGDFTAAHGAGRGLAVMEMLTGQIYLVTVIGILIGRRVGKAR